MDVYASVSSTWKASSFYFKMINPPTNNFFFSSFLVWIIEKPFLTPDSFIVTINSTLFQWHIFRNSSIYKGSRNLKITTFSLTHILFKVAALVIFLNNLIPEEYTCQKSSRIYQNIKQFLCNIPAMASSNYTSDCVRKSYCHYNSNWKWSFLWVSSWLWIWAELGMNCTVSIFLSLIELMLR